jgi:hypothetical protein
MFIVLGAFFGTSLDKWINRKSDKKQDDSNTPTENTDDFLK